VTTILIVDDQPDNLYVLERLLKREGLDVVQALDGEAALELAARERPDLILLDVMMPGIDGFEVLRRLREGEATRTIPVILLTANAPDQRLKIQGLNLGADEYLTQPINNHELMARIRSLLRTRTIQQDLEDANDHLRTLLSVIQAGNSTLNLAEVAGRSTEALIRAAGMDAGAMWLIDGETTLLASSGLPNGDRCAALAALAAATLPAVLRDPTVRFGTTQAIYGDTPFDAPYQCVVVLPLVHREQAVGMVHLWCEEVCDPFAPSEMAFLRAIADAAATSVQNARLFEETDRQRRQLEALDGEKDEFISIVAHELKNPLASIKGYAGLLARRARNNPANAAALKGLDVIEQQVARMTTLLDQLRDVSHIGINRFDIEAHVIDLVPLVERVAATMQSTSADHVLELTLPTQPVWASVDEFRLEQVLVNLLSNAIKYSPDGGAVEIAVDHQPAPPEVAAQPAPPGGWATITVRDHGVGIPKVAQERLFERFFRAPNAKGSVSGMGLGLFISREIVQRHGGVLWVQSEEGEGSTFGVALPAATAQEIERAEADGRQDGVVASEKR
jgi:signal transduction histidine kinase/CheY-like chemotaxis protein